MGRAPRGRAGGDRIGTVRITHVGGPTALLAVGAWRLLTDPTFDPGGGRYRFGWGTGSRKVTGPAIAVDDLAPIDAVLLSHDHHADNLDPAGRALLPSAGVVVTTASGARRLGGAIGLEPWATPRLEAPGRPPIEVTATPCRHGVRGVAQRLCRLLRRTAIPTLYEGWGHFRQGRDEMKRELARAPDAVASRVRWLPIGQPVEVEV